MNSTPTVFINQQLQRQAGNVQQRGSQPVIVQVKGHQRLR